MAIKFMKGMEPWYRLINYANLTSAILYGLAAYFIIKIGLFLIVSLILFWVSLTVNYPELSYRIFKVISNFLKEIIALGSCIMGIYLFNKVCSHRRQRE
jgi:hypothetical protein